VRSFGAVSFQQRRDAFRDTLPGENREMTIEEADRVMDVATEYLRELCPPGMQFVLIVGTVGTDGRTISYGTNLPADRTYQAADMLREALEMAQKEDT
jgi:hypothetical protein